MDTLIVVFLFFIPLLVFSWVFKPPWSLLSQVFFTALFLIYLSPVSFFLLAFITTATWLVLYKTNWQRTLRLVLCLSLFTGMLIVVKLHKYGNAGWIVPLGISYYLFRNIHVLVEWYLGKLPVLDFMEFAGYNFFLPVIIIGPINRIEPFRKELNRRRFNAVYFSAGLERILYGITKIQLIGNVLLSEKLSAAAIALPVRYTWLKIYLENVKFTLNGYFQFAGYSDIAIGLSLLLGIKVLENFNYPFLATNMREFWSRYHISLSGFCRDYVYTPIASYYRKPLLGVLLTMTLIGLWHEISPRYFIWGLLQVLGIYASSLIRLKGSATRIFICRLAVFNYFLLTCVILNAASLQLAVGMYRTLFFLN